VLLDIPLRITEVLSVYIGQHIVTDKSEEELRERLGRRAWMIIRGACGRAAIQDRRIAKEQVGLASLRNLNACMNDTSVTELFENAAATSIVDHLMLNTMLVFKTFDIYLLQAWPAKIFIVK
jgi:hypothetical protein